MQRFYDWLDRHAFPVIVTYATHRLHITALLLLGVVLIIGGAFPQVELVGGNYSNIVSAVVASVVLLKQNEHHRAVHARLDTIEQQTKKKARVSRGHTETGA